MRFYTDSIALSYSDVKGARQWWVSAQNGPESRQGRHKAPAV